MSQHPVDPIADLARNTSATTLAAAVIELSKRVDALTTAVLGPVSVREGEGSLRFIRADGRNAIAMTSEDVRLPHRSGEVSLTPLLEGHTGRHEDAEGRLDGHDGDVDRIDDKNAQQDGRMDQHNDRITNNRQRLDGHDGRLDDHAGRIGSAEGRLDSHASRLGSAENRIGAAEGRLDSHAGRIGGAESDINGLQGRMGNAESKNSQQDDRLDAHASRLGTLEAKQITDRSDIRSLETYAGANRYEIGRLWDALADKA